MLSLTPPTHYAQVPVCRPEWFILKRQEDNENAQLIGVVTAT